MHSEDSYFQRASPKQKVPKDVIEHTKQQQQAIEEVLCALDKQGQRQVGEQQDEEPLKRAIC